MTSKKRPGKRKIGNPAKADGDGFPGMLSDKGKDLFVAAVDLVGRTGAKEFQARWSDDEEPVVYMAVGKWGDTYEVGAGMDPVHAVLRLLDQVIDGGTCAHCHKTTGVTTDLDTMPLDQLVCWYQYDPELKTFRRGCE